MSIESLKKRVQKRYPGCVAMVDYDDAYYIVHDDVSLHDIFMIPGCETEDDAWRVISQFVQVEQSINRTHPLKAMISEHKKLQSLERIANRIHNTKK
mgnify:CR=1 FL=1|jgi:hypothetical protein